MDIKIKQPLEKDIQNACCEYLVLKKYYIHRANNIPIFNKSLGIFRSMPKYAKKGFPDIVVLCEKGTVYLEIKRPGGKLSEDQIVFQKVCQKFNIPYYMITSVDELVKIL